MLFQINLLVFLLIVFISQNLPAMLHIFLGPGRLLWYQSSFPSIVVIRPALLN